MRMPSQEYTSKQIEEMVFEFAHVQYKIGRLETDGNDTEKEYNKLIKTKEELSKIIAEFFKNLY